MSNNASACIQSIGVYGQVRIHVLSFVFGAWVLCKKLTKWLWKPKGYGKNHLRDTPPQFLLDGSYGQHKHVKLKGGVKLHYVESGPTDQPLILLLHGFPDFWLSWRYQIPVLSVNSHVVALDLKGFGDSDKPEWRNSYRIDRVLDELADFVQALGTTDRPCTLIGHDLGALLGWFLVHKYPDLIDKFIAVSCPHPNVYWTACNSNYPWLNYVQLPYLPEIDALTEDVKIIDHYHRHLPAKDVHLEAYKYAFSRKEDWTGAINYYRNLPFLKIGNREERLDRMIEVPVVLITGSKDRYVSLEGIVKSTEFCERFRLKVMEDCGHFPHQENPEAFNDVVLKYLMKNATTPKDQVDGTSKRLISNFFGAVSSTIKYGNSMIGTVQKKTNGMVNSIPFNLNLNNSSASS